MTLDSVNQLGRVGFEVSDLSAWESFGTEILGLQAVGHDPDGATLLRMDKNHHRLALSAGPRDDITFAGWQVADAAVLDGVAERLRRHGSPVRPGTPDDTIRRGVGGLIFTEDPSGLVHEIYWAPQSPASHFESPRGTDGFVADDLGLGHIVLNVDDMEANLGFFLDGLGLLVSDYIDIDTGDPTPATVVFLHCGPRHHSLALAPFGSPKHLHHLMIEVRNPDDVGTTYDMCLDRGVPIASTLGRHTNDRMTSFYAVTPSGFQIEYGYGGVTIDDATWDVRTYDAPSTWGHRTPAGT